tara:strand:- start:405473 stop:405757 length:285 start_codon:yes stop_codon:yes gene_type:complete
MNTDPLTTANRRIEELEAKVQDLELKREIDAAGAVDKETVMLYAVEALDRGSDDIPAVIRELKKAKPFLFTTTRPLKPSTRTETLRYMRARRGN